MKYSIRYKVARELRKVGIQPNPTKCPEVIDMQKTMAALSGGSIQFEIHKESNGEWFAKSVNIPGIMTCGNAKDDVTEMIKDAIFTYFGVPPEYCDDALLRATGESTVIQQRVFATA